MLIQPNLIKLRPSQFSLGLQVRVISTADVLVILNFDVIFFFFQAVNGDAGGDENNSLFGEASKFHKPGLVFCLLLN